MPQEVDLPWPSNSTGTVAYALGKEFQFLTDGPRTVLEENFLPGDTTVSVTSTHGFPSSGWIAVHKDIIQYTGKTATSFTGCTGLRALAAPSGAVVRLMYERVYPPVYELNPNNHADRVTLPPTASNVIISGTAEVDSELVVSYAYAQSQGMPEGATSFRWLRDDVAISGATASAYTQVPADIGAVITVEVTVRTATGLVGAAVVSAPTSVVLGAEQHYMPFNGTSDYGTALAAATGVKDALGWTLIVKVSGRVTPIADGYAQVYDENATFPRNLVTWIYSGQSGSNRVAALGYETDGTDNYRLLPALEDASGVQVFAAVHRDTAARAGTLYVAKAGATLSSTTAAATEARSPLHVGVGCALNGSSAPVATYYAAANIVAVVLLRDLASEAEVQAYSLADDARAVWPDAQIFGYWPMSRLVDDEAPNLGFGTAVPLTLVGPVAGDLVAL